MSNTVTIKKSNFSFFDSAKKHPIISVIIFCFLLFPFGFCELKNITQSSYIYLIAVFIILSILLVCSKNFFNSTLYTALFIGASVIIFFIFYLICYKNNNNLVCILMFVSTLSLLITAVMFMYKAKTLDTTKFIFLMIIAAIILRYIYCLYTDSLMRQHDVGAFNSTAGHANYIEWWYNNGLKLPDFDVRSVWQYYHPPLHHIIMALLLRILTTLKMDYNVACEALQILPLIYSSLCIIISYKLFKFVKIKGLPLIAAMSVVCFCPQLITISGAFNNDVLAFLLTITAAYLALKWYKNRNMKNIIFTAIAMGLAMMTKMASWIVAPAIAFLFLFAFINGKGKRGTYFLQFIVFGLICIPLALWWQIRNYFAFGVPITYIQQIGTNHPQFISQPWTERLLDFSHISFVYVGMESIGAPFYDTNPTLGLIKSATFDEGDIKAINSTNFPQISRTGPILFYIALTLAIIFFICFLISMFSKKSQLNFPNRVFFLIFVLLGIFMVYVYSYMYPFTCTMNIRYCLPVLILLPMGFSLFMQYYKTNKIYKKIFKYFSYVLVASYSIMSIFMFLQIA